jgi:polyhydroxyalkanoate synthesis regulator protein
MTMMEQAMRIFTPFGISQGNKSAGGQGDDVSHEPAVSEEQVEEMQQRLADLQRQLQTLGKNKS